MVRVVWAAFTKSKHPTPTSAPTPEPLLCSHPIILLLLDSFCIDISYQLAAIRLASCFGCADMSINKYINFGPFLMLFS